MATVPAITDGNTWATKSDAVSVPPGEEAEHVSAADLNAAKARLAEHATAINANDGLITAAQADATQALSDAAAAQATADAAVVAPSPTVVGNVAVFADTAGAIVDSGAALLRLIYGATPTTHTTSTKTLNGSEVLGHTIIDSDTIGGDCTVTVPHDLGAGFKHSFRLAGTGGNLILTPSGGIALHGYGVDPVSGDVTVTGENAIAHVFVESTGDALITVATAGA